MGDLRVEVSPDAAAYIARHEGQLFIWVDRAGLLHWHLEPPKGEMSWSLFEEHGVTVNVDESARDVSWWRVGLHHLPWQRLDVTSDLTVGIRPSSPPGSF
jgi:hypothetical protein